MGWGMYLDVIDKPHVFEPVFIISTVVGHFSLFIFNLVNVYLCMVGFVVGEMGRGLEFIRPLL